MSANHRFGGDWTADKLSRLKAYLIAFNQALKNKPFARWYLDAFAGCGYIDTSEAQDSELVFPGFSDSDSQGFLMGSARVALEVEPPFHEYVFFEQRRDFCVELECLRAEHAGKKISIEQGDANELIRRFCESHDWHKNRAVLFLDPYGMQVEWTTLQAVACTQAIDLWILFPLATMRLLRNDGDIPPGWRRRLNALFGEEAWFQEFYRVGRECDLVGYVEKLEKIATFESIGDYFLRRLRTIFPAVLDSAVELVGSKGQKLYLLCYALANPSPSATELGLRIARHIVEKL